VAGGWNRDGDAAAHGTTVSTDAHRLAARVFETGRPSRIDTHPGAALGVPITVDSRYWGLLFVSSTAEALPPVDAESLLTDFAELAATAVANADAEAELAASRARLVANADGTRRRLERDLHEGAQQRLVVLALHLREAIAGVPAGLDDLAAQLDRVWSELDEAIAELREFARGIHPAILTEAGLAPALRVLARRSDVPVELDVGDGPRLPESVEVAAYCVVSAVLTNAAEHGHASTVMVDVEAADDVLRVDVRDDGAELAEAGGILALRDRVEALGGRMSLASDPRAGTSVSVALPLAGDDGAAAA
jgi:signal transduction histidine kinase